MERQIIVDAKYIAALKLFAAVKDVRERLVAISVEASAKEARLMTTDGHRMAIVRAGVNGEASDTQEVQKAVIPLVMFEHIKPFGSVLISLEAPLEEANTGSLSRKVNINWNGMTKEGVSLDECGVDWRRVFPREVSFKAGHFDLRYLGDLTKVQKLLGLKTSPVLAQNGPEKAAVVFFGDDAIQALVMPMRIDNDSLPDTFEWVLDSLETED